MTDDTTQQPSPFSDQVLVALRKIIRATDLHSRKLLRQFGLTGPQLVSLREIAARGELSGSSLAKAISVSLPTATGIVARLESRGLVLRRRSSSDRRQMLVSITEAGKHVLETAPPPLQETFTDQLEALPDWEQTQILSVLQRVVAMMEAEELDASPILTTGVISEPGPVPVTVDETSGEVARGKKKRSAKGADPAA